MWNFIEWIFRGFRAKPKPPGNVCFTCIYHRDPINQYDDHKCSSKPLVDINYITGDQRQTFYRCQTKNDLGQCTEWEELPADGGELA